MDNNENKLSPRLLIIDDNFANVLLLEKMLKANGYHDIKTLTDSTEAVNVYKSYKPDLLLLDLKMPFFDGFQVMEQLNAIKGADYIPVIVITAENDKEQRLRALEYGAKDYIIKPFDKSEILMRIRNMLEIRLLHNQVRNANEILEQKVSERTKKLEDMQIELLQRLLRAAEFRDTDTANHISRIGFYAQELGKVLGFSQEYCNMLLHASMMHDIGKIGIPDEILLKPAKLDDDEWVIMKTHTTKGAEILANSSSEIVKMAEQIALSHHEKYDGSGYPNGLKGEEIPLAGRITAICDVFDALLSNRPYKVAWTLEEVIEELKNGSGKHFDPIIVDTFLEDIESFVRIREQFN